MLMTVREVLKHAEALLNSDEAKLEAQLLLQHILSVNHAWLICHADVVISQEQVHAFDALIKRRVRGEPIAYLTGEREFFGLPLKVSVDTLIPRSDTETLVELALDTLDGIASDQISVLDLGTGTGAIALAIAHFHPEASIVAVDASSAALSIAQHNAAALNLQHVEFIQSDWFDQLPSQRFDLIVSNPPYIEANDPHLSLGDLRFEPLSALASGESGLDDIEKILADCLVYLKPQGWLMLEHGYNQANAVQALMAQAGLVDIKTVQDLGGNDRVTVGKNPLIVSLHWATE